MRLQERILEALGEHALKPRALYDALSPASPAEIDCGLGALRRARKVSFELGFYQRTEYPRGSPPTGEQALPPAASTATIAAAGGPETAMRRCRRCGHPKPLAAFPLSHLGNGSRLKTCDTCMQSIVKRPRGPRKKIGAVAVAPPIPSAIVERLLKPLHEQLVVTVETLERDLKERREQLRDVEQLIQAGDSP